jgi:hypothetical protein
VYLEMWDMGVTVLRSCEVSTNSGPVGQYLLSCTAEHGEGRPKP